MELETFSFDVFHSGVVVTHLRQIAQPISAYKEVRGMVMKRCKNLIDLIIKSNFFKYVFGATTYRRQDAQTMKIRVE